MAGDITNFKSVHDSGYIPVEPNTPIDARKLIKEDGRKLAKKLDEQMLATINTDTLDEQWAGKTPMERFIDRIEVKENDCWQWKGSLVSNGYGKFSIGDTQFYSHRFSYMVYIAEPPKGRSMQIDHLCRNRGCVNPEHLELVTLSENVARGESGINKRSITECPKGHPYNEANTYWKKSDKMKLGKTRVCRICMVDSTNRYIARKRNTR